MTLTAGIDVGSSAVKAVVMEDRPEHRILKFPKFGERPPRRGFAVIADTARDPVRPRLTGHTVTGP